MILFSKTIKYEIERNSRNILRGPRKLLCNSRTVREKINATGKLHRARASIQPHLPSRPALVSPNDISEHLSLYSDTKGDFPGDSSLLSLKITIIDTLLLLQAISIRVIPRNITRNLFGNYVNIFFFKENNYYSVFGI